LEEYFLNYQLEKKFKWTRVFAFEETFRNCKVATR
jgi:hypothetical protein